MSETRAEMYQTVREVLEKHHKWHLDQTGTDEEFGICLADAYAESTLAEDTGAALASLDALDALEAEEREAPNAVRGVGSGPLPGRNVTAVQTGDKTLFITTPPAPPAVEAITTAFARDFFVRHDHAYSGIEIYEWLKKQVTGPVAPPAAEYPMCGKCGHPNHQSKMHQDTCTVYVSALGAECGCTGPAPPAAGCAIGIVQEVAEQFDGNDEQFHAGYVSACEVIEARIRNFNAALAAPCECQRLREERAKWHSVNEAVLNQADRDEELADQYRAELAAAKSEIARLNQSASRIVAGFVAAYDAKHGEKS